MGPEFGDEQIVLTLCVSTCYVYENVDEKTKAVIDIVSIVPDLADRLGLLHCHNSSEPSMEKVKFVEREVEDLDEWIVPGGKKEERDLFLECQFLHCRKAS